MLQEAFEIRGLKPRARDGDIGKLHDLYFSDPDWTIRYLVFDTGAWLSGRKVLISPRAVEALDVSVGELRIDLTREQIEKSPDYDSSKPVSRRYERQYCDYYGFPYYWSGPCLWGASDYAVPPAPLDMPAAAGPDKPVCLERTHNQRTSHLRSARNVAAYRIDAPDGNVGQLESFLFEDGAWCIRGLIVYAGNWWPGKHVLIAPAGIDRMDYTHRRIRLGIARESLKPGGEYAAHSNPQPPAKSTLRCE